MQNADMPGYMSISEFARIAEVSRKTLIFYDMAGVFSPAYTASNGYRYYSHEQIYMISVILMFRELGTPLSVIKNYANNCTPAEAAVFLEQRLRSITGKIEELKCAQDMLNVKLSELKASTGRRDEEIKMSAEPALPIFISEPVRKNKNDIPDDEWLRFYMKCKENRVIWGYPEGFSVSAENLKKRRSIIAENIICHVGNKKYANAFILRGLYVSLCGTGSFHDTEPLYQKLFEYIEANGLAIAGPSYEKRLIDEAATEDRSLQRIQVRIGVLQP